MPQCLLRLFHESHDNEWPRRQRQIGATLPLAFPPRHIRRKPHCYYRQSKFLSSHGLLARHHRPFLQLSDAHIVHDIAEVFAVDAEEAH